MLLGAYGGWLALLALGAQAGGRQVGLESDEHGLALVLTLALTVAISSRAWRRARSPDGVRWREFTKQAGTYLLCGFGLIYFPASKDVDLVPDALAGAVVFGWVLYLAVVPFAFGVVVTIRTYRAVEGWAVRSAFRAGGVGALAAALTVVAMLGEATAAMLFFGLLRSDELPRLAANAVAAEAPPPRLEMAAASGGGGSRARLGSGRGVAGGGGPARDCLVALGDAPPTPTSVELGVRWMMGRWRYGRDEAEDLAQTALLSTCTTRPDAAPLPAYYFTTLENAAKKRYGRARRWAACPLYDDELPCPTTSPFDDAVHRDDVELVERLTCKLDDEARRIIRLRHDDGLEFAAIAARIGKSANATKKKYKRALDKMRSEFERLESRCAVRRYSPE